MAPSESSNGLLLIIERDQAKQLFGAKGDEPLMEFLSSFVADESNATNILDLQQRWRNLHSAFCGGDDSTEAGSPPLNQCILGGRPLSSDDEKMIVRLVRPDVIQHIANASNEFDIEASKGHYESENSDADWEAGRSLLENVLQHFRTAAEKRAAVVFFVTF